MTPKMSTDAVKIPRLPLSSTYFLVSLLLSEVYLGCSAGDEFCIWFGRNFRISLFRSFKRACTVSA